MKLIKPSYEILSYPTDVIKNISAAARLCYMTDDYSSKRSDEQLVKFLLKRGHMAMIEFGGVITVQFKIDRSMSHELVRHRLASFAQSSQRYIKYVKDIEFIIPEHIQNSNDPDDKKRMCEAFENVEKVYHNDLEAGATPQEARYILPNATATCITMQANTREWLHILDLRSSSAAYPPLRKLMRCLLSDLHVLVPVIFDDLYYKYVINTQKPLVHTCNKISKPSEKEA